MGITLEADVVAAVHGEGSENELGHFLDVAEVGGGLLEDDGQEGIDSLLDIDLLPHVEDFVDHAQHILDDLGLAGGE